VKIHLLFFGPLREITGHDNQTVEMPEGTTLGELAKTIRNESAAAGMQSMPFQMAVNEALASPDLRLQPGSSVAFLPPVSGG